MVNMEVDVGPRFGGSKHFNFCFLGVDSESVARVLEKVYGFCVEWIGGSDFEFWRDFENGQKIDGVVWGGIYDDDLADCVLIVNANEWVVGAIIEKFLRMVGETPWEG